MLEYDAEVSPEEQDLLQKIFNVYTELSPENLCCDGELPPSQVKRRYADCYRRLNGLFKTLGRSVSEDEIYNWKLNKKSRIVNKE